MRLVPRQRFQRRPASAAARGAARGRSGEGAVEFRSGTRIGYISAMSEALSGIAPDDPGVLASYLAQFCTREAP
jgi:hypothetical protein